MSKATNRLSKTNGLRAPRHKIKVNEEVISTARRANSAHCVGADAIKWQVPHAANISVDLQTVRYSDRTRGERYVYLTPRILQECIIAWDAGQVPKPFNFSLLGASVHLTQRKQPNGKRRPPGKKRLIKPRKGTHTPSTFGGPTPPAGLTRRQFGMRAFDKGAMNLETEQN